METRTGSAIPVSTFQTESTVIPVPIDKAWHIFQAFALEKVVPTKIKATKFTTGAPSQVGATVQIDYADGAKWELRINEISEFHNTIGYEVISTEPAHTATSIGGRIKLRQVTDDNTTFVQWSTSFSNDADANVIADQKYKKQEFFCELKKALQK